MRLDSLVLNWFRGAADRVVLDLSSRNVVVYGDNGTGKSSFVDAFEYLIANGRIEHLSHEYARREPNIRNTRTPDDSETYVEYIFDGGGEIRVEISEEERREFTSTPEELLEQVQSWKLERHILRQHEVSDFIKATKREKYSILSPLIGLDRFETIASNMLTMIEAIYSESSYDTLLSRKTAYENNLATGTGTADLEAIEQLFGPRLINYGINESGDLLRDSDEALTVLEERKLELQPALSRFESLRGIISVELTDNVDEYLALSEGHINLGTEILNHRLVILEQTSLLVDLDNEISQCPACGQVIEPEEIREHLHQELEQLREHHQIRENIRQLRQVINDKIIGIKGEVEKLSKHEAWIGDHEDIRDIVRQWLNFPRISDSVVTSIDQISDLSTLWTVTTDLINREYSGVPTSIDNILEDTQFFKSTRTIPECKELTANIKKINSLLSALNQTHENIRERIQVITSETLEEISGDVQRIWSILHPDQPINGITLIQTEDADRSIDIGLQFYGIEQPSPRLTLSEGYRNSLGLAIFIALATRGSTENHPLVLDDIVSSLDREHRGLIIDVIRSELTDRQVILLTHDREWYDELRRRLISTGQWNFFLLRPFVDPSIGIRITPTMEDFDVAREFLPDQPNAAGNKVRAIMDEQLAFHSERLELSLPFIRGPGNDHRTGVDFIQKLISEGRSKFRILNGTEYIENQEAINCWDQARELLMTWANRASHGGSLSLTEANQMIDFCSRSLDHFYCTNPDCQSAVWRTIDGGRRYCRCRSLRWNG